MNNAKKLVEVLEKEGLTIGSIESFTGGLFGKYITDIDGASAVYKGGLICYSTELKTSILGIKKEFIDEYGVVSSAVAERMAIRGLKLLNVDICVSFTGNAGPSVCDDQTTVGECYMSIAYNGSVWDIPLKLTDLDRDEVRKVSVESLIDTVLSIISK